ncbi:PH domain-containing protein [Corynebacterium mastitidis]|uniref:PH domain-containing protein n=1 Tax=Corynebacterium mastitidis TaxID=161890 RepID=A0ABU8NXZ7_9CORY
MAGFSLEPRERVVVDVSAPLSTLTLPALEAILLTGVAWIVIGYLDRPEVSVSLDLRNALVGLWALALCWRLVLPLCRVRRQRFMVTTRRILVRGPGLGARTDEMPLHYVRGARKKGRGRLALGLMGYDRPLVFARIPRPKRVAQAIDGLTRW